VLLRPLLLLILFWVIARAFWTLLEGVVKGASAPGATDGGGGSRGARSPVKMAPCPVCGTYVVPGKAISATVGGHTEFFCSDKCRVEYQSR
jgi:YHS domain-containing protein